MTTPRNSKLDQPPPELDTRPMRVQGRLGGWLWAAVVVVFIVLVIVIFVMRDAFL